MQIYIGNLPQSYTDEELRELFAQYGTVRRATIGRDRKSGGSQGYGFVEMPVKSEGRAAIESLRGKVVEGNALRVRALKHDDDFHRHAILLHRGVQPGPKTTKPFQGNIGARGAGAIRRTGQRGT
jgi:RNA recognition motif-containing protein